MNTNKNNIVFLGVLLVLLFLCSCQKSGSEDPYVFPQHGLFADYSEAKTAGNYIMYAKVGHPSKDCPGCVMYFGRKVHRDCMGHGNYCNVTASIHIDTVGTYITATTTDTFGLTTEDFFLMPDRSLDYEDEKGSHLFLNIPGQMVYRDTATQQFTFMGLSFSSAAVYSNN